MKFFSLVGILLFILSCQKSDGGIIIMPDNDLDLEDDAGVQYNISEEKFYEIVEEFQSIYSPIIAQHNGFLKIEADWDDSTVNATASQDGDVWIVNMYGGLARRPEVTIDGFKMVLCHEIGHHLGGYPFVSPWASNEGQADYYATTVCARHIFKEEYKVNRYYRNIVDGYVKRLCDEVWFIEEDRDLCYRIAMAGKSLADLLGAGTGGVQFYTPDESAVKETLMTHPEPQCRLDTYLAGALCLNANWDHSWIPGKSLGLELLNSPESEAISNAMICARYNGYEKGVRPRCWYKPLME